MFGKLFGKPPSPPPFVYIAPVVAMYEKLNFPAANGCAVSDVRQLEKKGGQRFPVSYFEFLRWMGNGAGQFLDGSRCFFRHVPTLKQQAINLLRENKFPTNLPDDATVFWMHQGYQFLFIRATEGENPPVHWYHEGRHATDFEFNRYPSFAGFLADELAGHAFLEEAISGVACGIQILRKEPVCILDRNNDAELKGLHQVAEKLSGAPNQKGTIRLTSESRMCIACRYALKQFNEKFPNIKVEVQTLE